MSKCRTKEFWLMLIGRLWDIRRYCDQYRDVIMHVKSVLNNYMSKQDYTVTPNLEYKDGSHSLSRFVDFLERFVQANQELIRDHDEKQSQGKKTRRIIPDRYFREVTQIMA